MAILIKERATALTAIIEPSDGKYVIYCPELDLATEGDTPEEAFEDLVDMTMDYAQQYMEEFEAFSKSPNRAAHSSYITAIHSMTSKEQVKSLFN